MASMKGADGPWTGRGPAQWVGQQSSDFNNVGLTYHSAKKSWLEKWFDRIEFRKPIDAPLCSHLIIPLTLDRLIPVSDTPPPLHPIWMNSRYTPLHRQLPSNLHIYSSTASIPTFSCKYDDHLMIDVSVFKLLVIFQYRCFLTTKMFTPGLPLLVSLFPHFTCFVLL